MESLGLGYLSLGALWAAMLGCFLVVLLLPNALGLNRINGLFVFQLALFFCSIVMVAGTVNGNVSLQLLAHFFLTEIFFYLGIILVYKRALPNLAVLYLELVSRVHRFPLRFICLIVGLLIFKVMTKAEEGSRIFYMTQSWFSFVKPVVTLIEPLAYFASLSLFFQPRTRFYGYVSIALSVSANVYSGSKASFVFGYLTTFLFIRDAGLIHVLNVKKRNVVMLLLGVGAAAFATIATKGIDFFKLMERFLLFSEANVLTYFTPDPTSACQGLSLFARMHRGLARMLGDSGAQNIDTLFGYALNIQIVGVNTFTGPNARFSAYMVCNFPDWEILAGAFVSVLYLAAVSLVIYYGVKIKNIGFMFLPMVIFSIIDSGQDFNLIMRDVLYYSAAIIGLAFLYHFMIKQNKLEMLR